MKSTHGLPLFFMLLSALAGCSLDVDEESSDAPGSSQAAAQEACGDVRSAFVAAFVRCGADEQQVSDGFDEQIDCSEIKAVKDSESLYEDCIGGLEEIECAALLDGMPESCEGQLLH